MKSLNTRLVLTVLATATLAFSAFVALTFLRLSQGLDLQATQLSVLSEEKLAQKLDGEARLARARVETLMEDMGRRLETIAQRTDIVKAIASGNGITISEPLGRAARSADIDGIL